ncbi:MAG TPA: acyl-CoA dehydrogenase family protein [Acidimicrobiales bacterium]|nr:acyl-CoA dehydrogenase family protein [Acidimicrobiales bacterium]
MSSTMTAGFDHRLDPELEELRRLVERFAHEVIAPQIGAFYEREEFPYEIVRRLGELGVFGIPFPEEFGGMGGDLFGLSLALEELARVDTSVAITVEAAVDLGAMAIHRYGSDAQRAEWLPRLCSGEMLAGFGLTEPDGGSDAGALRTRAERVGDDWVINGAKSFITNSGTSITGCVVVAALTGGGGERAGISTILIPAGTPGFDVGKSYSKVGWGATDTHELAFTDCRVPVENLIGVEGRGYAQFLQILDEGRVAIAAICTGLAQGCLDEAVRYAGERVAFGQPIGQFEGIQFKLADMDARAHTARLAYWQAASKALRGEPFKREAAIAKLVGSEAAMQNARDATQIFGGYGFMNESPVGRFYRDAKALEIGEGTSEILRLLIARELGLSTPLGRSEG